VRVTIEGMTPGKQKVGRPKRRWRDDITAWTGLSWKKIIIIIL